MPALSLKNIFKYIKIVLVHPATEIFLDICYIFSMVFIGIIIFEESKTYDDHTILDMTESYLNYNQFINIKTEADFNAYLSFALNRLFLINPQTQDIPLFVPISPIRFVWFQNSNECNDKIDYTTTCINDPNKFKCVIDNLSKSFNLQCGKKFKASNGLFQKVLTGYYSSYNIQYPKNFIDITRETYDSTYQNKINGIIKDKSLSALLMQINLIAPSNHNFIDIVLSVEMTNYFTDVKTIFSVNILNDRRPKTRPMLFIFIMLLCFAVVFNIIKLFYEINVKCIWSVHIFYFFSQIFDAIFMVICILYIFEDQNLEFKVNLESFESHSKYILIVWHMKIFYSILVICFPFRFLGLISWWKRITEPFTIILNTLFRMSPGILITFIFFIVIHAMFTFTNYFVFNDVFSFYQTMFNSFLSAFDFKILITVYDRKKPSKIFSNLFQSSYSVAILFFQVVYFYFYCSIVIATLAYLHKKAIILQEPPEENKYVTKLDEIEQKLEEKKALENIKEDSLKKQILWLNLDEDKKYNSEMASKYQILFFKNSNQILSFLKYIFAIKPELQFKKLIFKINIVVEINKKKFGHIELKQISRLADWFTFVGCKIPIIIFGNSYFDHSIKIKLHNIYKFTRFINDEEALYKILENKGKKVLSISVNNNFSFNSEELNI